MHWQHSDNNIISSKYNQEIGIYRFARLIPIEYFTKFQSSTSPQCNTPVIETEQSNNHTDGEQKYIDIIS